MNAQAVDTLWAFMVGEESLFAVSLEGVKTAPGTTCANTRSETGGLTPEGGRRLHRMLPTKPPPVTCCGGA